MSRTDLDLCETVHAVAEGVSLRPEERRAILETLKAGLESGGSFYQASGPAWRWLSAAVVSLLMLVSLAGPWPQAPVVAAKACITPHVQVTPLPKPEGVFALGTDSPAHVSATPVRPGAMAAPNAFTSWEHLQTLEPAQYLN